MFNSIQLYGAVLLGGLVSGELARRVFSLPRPTGYVLFGLLLGESGLNWIQPLQIESAGLFIELALGLILFELGYLVPRTTTLLYRARFATGVAVSLGAGALLLLLFRWWGFPLGASLFAAILCLATSPAITIATCSDVGAEGERTGLLYTLVATNGAIAFAALVLLVPFLNDIDLLTIAGRLGGSLGSIMGAMILGGACAGTVLLGAECLEGQPERQRLLILGTIVMGVGTAMYLGVSVFLPMLIFGLLVSTIDRENKVLAVRIASDAQVFLIITFVLAGAAIDIAYLLTFWKQALMIVAARLLGQWVGVVLTREGVNLGWRESAFATIGLLPMSSIALVLLVDIQMRYSGFSAELSGMLMSTILLMQLVGPLATQTAIKGFGEATRLMPSLAGNAATAGNERESP